MQVLLLDVAPAHEAHRLDRHAPALHHACVLVLRLRVGGDDQQEPAQREQAVGLLAAQPALVSRREVLEQQAEHDHVEDAARQFLYGVAQVVHVRGQRVGRDLQRLHRLQMQEVAAINTLGKTQLTMHVLI